MPEIFTRITLHCNDHKLGQSGPTCLTSLTYLMRRVGLRMKPLLLLLLLLLFLQSKRGREVAGPRRRLLRGREIARCPTVTQVRIHRAPLLRSRRSLQKCCWSRKDFFGVGGEGGDVLRTGMVPAAAAAPTAAASLLPLSNGGGTSIDFLAATAASQSVKVCSARETRGGLREWGRRRR